MAHDEVCSRYCRDVYTVLLFCAGLSSLDLSSLAPLALVPPRHLRRGTQFVYSHLLNLPSSLAAATYSVRTRPWSIQPTHIQYVHFGRLLALLTRQKRRGGNVSLSLVPWFCRRFAFPTAADLFRQFPCGAVRTRQFYCAPFLPTMMPPLAHPPPKRLQFGSPKDTGAYIKEQVTIRYTMFVLVAFDNL